MNSNHNEVFSELSEEQIVAEPIEGLSTGIKIKGFPSLKNSDIFKAGKIEIQSEASQIICQRIAPQPGERIWDVCAGGGGKTLAFAAMLKKYE